MPVYKMRDGKRIELTREEEQEYNDRLNDPVSDPRKFTPLEVTEGFYSLIGEAATFQAIDDLRANDRRVYERWRSATLVDEDDPDLLAQLRAMNHTIEELTQAIDS